MDFIAPKASTTTTTPQTKLFLPIVVALLAYEKPTPGGGAPPAGYGGVETTSLDDEARPLPPGRLHVGRM
jgi:hypothetical protein